MLNNYFLPFLLNNNNKTPGRKNINKPYSRRVTLKHDENDTIKKGWIYNSLLNNIDDQQKIAINVGRNCETCTITLKNGTVISKTSADVVYQNSYSFELSKSCAIKLTNYTQEDYLLNKPIHVISNNNQEIITYSIKQNNNYYIIILDNITVSSIYTEKRSLINQHELQYDISEDNKEIEIIYNDSTTETSIPVLNNEHYIISFDLQNHPSGVNSITYFDNENNKKQQFITQYENKSLTYQTGSYLYFINQKYPVEDGIIINNNVCYPYILENQITLINNNKAFNSDNYYTYIYDYQIYSFQLNRAYIIINNQQIHNIIVNNTTEITQKYTIVLKEIEILSHLLDKEGYWDDHYIISLWSGHDINYGSKSCTQISTTEWSWSYLQRTFWHWKFFNNVNTFYSSEGSVTYSYKDYNGDYYSNPQITNSTSSNVTLRGNQTYNSIVELNFFNERINNQDINSILRNYYGYYYNPYYCALRFYSGWIINENEFKMGNECLEYYSRYHLRYSRSSNYLPEQCWVEEKSVCQGMFKENPIVYNYRYYKSYVSDVKEQQLDYDTTQFGECTVVKMNHPGISIKDRWYCVEKPCPGSNTENCPPSSEDCIHLFIIVKESKYCDTVGCDEYITIKKDQYILYDVTDEIDEQGNFNTNPYSWKITPPFTPIKNIIDCWDEKKVECIINSVGVYERLIAWSGLCTPQEANDVYSTYTPHSFQDCPTPQETQCVCKPGYYIVKYQWTYIGMSHEGAYTCTSYDWQGFFTKKQVKDFTKDNGCYKSWPDGPEGQYVEDCYNNAILEGPFETQEEAEEAFSNYPQEGICERGKKS